MAKQIGPSAIGPGLKMLQSSLDPSSPHFEPRKKPAAEQRLMVAVVEEAINRLEKDPNTTASPGQPSSQEATRWLPGKLGEGARPSRGSRINPMAALKLEQVRVRQELERVSRLKADFVDTMSHELRAPLNVITGYLDLVLDGEFGSLTAQQNDVLGRVSESAAELLDLINATLNLGRLEKGELSLNVEPVAVAELIIETTAETFKAHNKRSICLVLDVPSDLGAIHTDAIKLKVILRNLIANALKFTLRGTVTVGASGYGAGIAVSVSDTGIGITPEIVPIIFEPFCQGESAMTRRFGGVGLGLYVVRRLLDLLGGTVVMETEVGRGSTFKIWTPDQTPSRGAHAELGKEKL